MKTFLRVFLAVAVLTVLAGARADAGAPVDQQVKLRVTRKGFEPAVVTVQAGKPVTLLITRKTDRTCATEFVLKAYKVYRKLPLNKTVMIRFTPTSPGELDYACGMNMIHGKIVVK